MCLGIKKWVNQKKKRQPLSSQRRCPACSEPIPGWGRAAISGEDGDIAVSGPSNTSISDLSAGRAAWPSAANANLVGCSRSWACPDAAVPGWSLQVCSQGRQDSRKGTTSIKSAAEPRQVCQGCRDVHRPSQGVGMVQGQRCHPGSPQAISSL